MARRKSTVTQEELEALNNAIQTLAEKAARQYLGEDGLKRLVELVTDALRAKQDALTQGDNITIKDGVISATDTGATSAEASGESPLTLGAEYDKDTRKITVTGSVDLSDYAKGDDLKGYLPLSGGTLTGNLVAKDVEMDELIAHSVYLDDIASTLRNKGQTNLTLTENDDAPSVVVADDDGKLYKVSKSEIGGTDLTAITDAEIDALFDE